MITSPRGATIKIEEMALSLLFVSTLSFSKREDEDVIAIDRSSCVSLREKFVASFQFFQNQLLSLLLRKSPKERRRHKEGEETKKTQTVDERASRPTPQRRLLFLLSLSLFVSLSLSYSFLSNKAFCFCCVCLLLLRFFFLRSVSNTLNTKRPSFFLDRPQKFGYTLHNTHPLIVVEKNRFKVVVVRRLPVDALPKNRRTRN